MGFSSLSATVRGHTLREMSREELQALYEQLSAELPRESLLLANETHQALLREFELVENELEARD